MKSYIWVTTQQSNFHSWKDAKNDVEFLKYKHRHIFYFKVYIEVFHDDREIEFFQFKNFIEHKLESKKLWENKSCEMIADWLYNIIRKKITDRTIIIEVSEDNENGCRNEYL